MLITGIAFALGCGAGPASDPEDLDFRALEFPEDGIVTSKSVGTLEGAASVGADGSFNYEIPLWVPRGRAGMQPEVELSYNSNTPDGALGVGWSLNAGQSAIMRCNKNVARDGVANGVTFDDNKDIFCLGSQKLVEVEQGELPELYTPPWGTLMGEFRTERDEHARVLAYGDSSTYQTWDVLLPNGRIRRYGDSTLSRLEAERFQITGTVTLGWLLASEFDRSDNEIEYSYIQPDPTAATRLLSKIDYTVSSDPAYAAAPIRKVQLAYYPRPDPKVTYQFGLKFIQDRRLISVGMHAPNPNIVNEVRSYELRYDESLRTGRSLLVGIETCDGGQPAVCLPETTFEYAQPDGPEPVAFEAHFNTNLAGVVDPWKKSLTSVGDLNGDGFDDVMIRKKVWGLEDGDQRQESIPYAELSGGGNDGIATTFTEVSLDNLFGIGHADNHYRDDMALDIDADGQAELLVRTEEGAYPQSYYRRVVRFNPTTQLFELGAITGTQARRNQGQDLHGPIRQSVAPADADGDGLFDLFATQDETGYAAPQYGWIHGDKWRVYRNLRADPGTFALTPAPLSWTSLSMSGVGLDLYGDGRAGLAELSPGASMEFFEVDAQFGTLMLKTPPDSHEDFGEASTYIDINGDGLKDFLSMTDEDLSRPMVQLNTGNGFVGAYQAGTVQYPWPDQMHGPPSENYEPDNPQHRVLHGIQLRVADFNGDGLDDLLLLSQWDKYNEVGSAPTKRKDIWGAGYTNPALWLSDGTDLYAVAGVGEALNHITTTANGWIENLRLTDVDNDGMPDIVDLGPYGVIEQHWSDERPGCGFAQWCVNLDYYQLSVAKDASGPNARYSDRIISVTTGVGAVDQVEYQPHSPTDPTDLDPRYIAGTDCEYPETCARRGSPVVRSHSVHNPAGVAPHTLQYYYEDRRHNVRGRGNLGFRKVTAIDTASAKVTETVYDQTAHELDSGEVYPEAGMPVSRTTHISDALSSTARMTVETFERDVLLFDDRYRVRPSVLVTETFEDGWSIARTEERVLERDEHDFATLEETVVAGGTTTTASCEYDHRPAEAMLGLRTRETVTKVNSVGSETRQTQWSYDARGRLESTTTDAGAPVDTDTYLLTTQSYGPGGVVTTATRSNWGASDVRVDTTTWDADGIYPTHTINAVGHIREFHHHPAVDQIVAESEPYLGVPPANLLATKRQYDGFGRLRKTTRPDDTHDEIERFFVSAVDPAQGWYEQTTSIDNRWTRTYYDTRGRTFRESHSNADGQETGTLVEFDVRGREVKRWLPTVYPAPPIPKTTETHYDNYDRVTSVQTPQGLTTTSYPNPLAEQRTDPTGRVIFQSRNWDDQIAVTRREVDGAFQHTYYAYAPFGELASFTDPDGNVTSYQHDRLGRVIQQDSPDTGVSSSKTNPFGEDYYQQDAEGNIRTVFHDAIGRPLWRNTEDGLDSYSYDYGPTGVGKPYQAFAADGVVTTVRHDDRGRVFEEEVEYDGKQYITTTEYDPIYGWAMRISYPQLDDGYQLVVHYHHDPSNGRLESIEDESSGVLLWQAVDRDEMDRITHQKIGNVDAVSHYDPLGDRIESFVATEYGATEPLVERLYAHYADGRLQSLADGASTPNSIVQEMEYDGLGRLAKWRTTRAANPTAERRYDYTLAGSLDLVEDFVDDIAVNTGTGYAYVPGRPHVADAVGAWTFQHDAAGRETFAFDNGSPARAIGYTSRDLPRDGTIDGTPFTMQYDAFGTRFRKVHGAEETLYLGDRYEQRTVNGAIDHVFYVRGPEGIIAQVEPTEGGVEHAALIADPRQGSTIAIVTEGAAQRAYYGAFGARMDATGLVQSGSSSTPGGVTLGYTGHEHDDGMGLINMGGRVYDPVSRRMLTADPVRGPIELGRGFSQYEYVHDDPFNAIDPTGFEAQALGLDSFGMGALSSMIALVQAELSAEQDRGGHELRRYGVGTDNEDGTSYGANTPDAIGAANAEGDQKSLGVLEDLRTTFSPRPVTASTRFHGRKETTQWIDDTYETMRQSNFRLLTVAQLSEGGAVNDIYYRDGQKFKHDRWDVGETQVDSAQFGNYLAGYESGIADAGSWRLTTPIAGLLSLGAGAAYDLVGTMTGERRIANYVWTDIDSQPYVLWGYAEGYSRTVSSIFDGSFYD